MLVSEIIELLPAALDWMVLFNLQPLRPLFDDLTIKRMFLVPETASLAGCSHAVLTSEGTILAPQASAAGSGQLAWAGDGRPCPRLEGRLALRQRFAALARLLPLDEADCLGLGEIPGYFPPVLLHVIIQGDTGQARAVFSQEPACRNYELLRAVGVRYLDGEWQDGRFVARFTVDLRQHIFPGLLSNFTKTGYCNAFFLQQGGISQTLEAGLSGAVHDRARWALSRGIEQARRLAQGVLATGKSGAGTLSMQCQPPLGAPAFDFGDLPPAALLCRGLKTAAGAQDAGLAQALEDWLRQRRTPPAGLEAGLWSFQSGDIPTATDSALVLLGLDDPQSVAALERFADGQGGYVPQLVAPRLARESPPPDAMRVESWNAHWQQADFATTCLVRHLRRQAGLPPVTGLEWLAAAFAARAGLFFANPYWVDWSLALALAGDPADAAEELRRRLAAEIAASVNPDHSFGVFDAPLSTALAILSLEALEAGSRLRLMAQLRLAEMAGEDGAWPVCTPFYSALRLPESLADLYRLSGGDDPAAGVLRAGPGYFLVTRYIDRSRMIATALACLALAGPGPADNPDSWPAAAAREPHPRYRCATQSAYLAGFALPPYLAAQSLDRTLPAPALPTAGGAGAPTAQPGDPSPGNKEIEYG